jgi:hypothetical protein
MFAIRSELFIPYHPAHYTIFTLICGVVSCIYYFRTGLMGMFKQRDSDEVAIAMQQGMTRTIGEFACHCDAPTKSADDNAAVGVENMVWRKRDGAFIALKGVPVVMPPHSPTPIKVYKNAFVADKGEIPDNFVPGV